jgi:serine protease Do
VGDIIVQLNFGEVDTIEALQQTVPKLKAGDKVPLLVNRQGNPLFLALELPK